MIDKKRYEHVALSILIRHHEQAVSRREMVQCYDDAEFYRLVDQASQNLILGMELPILAGEEKQVDGTQTVTSPLTWFQHLKERRFPKWWLRRWPVKYKTITIVTATTHVRVCPHVQTSKIVQGKAMNLHVMYLLERDPQCCDFCRRPVPDGRLRRLDVDHLDRCPTCGKLDIPEAKP